MITTRRGRRRQASLTRLAVVLYVARCKCCMLHVASAVLHALLQTSPTQLVVVLFFEVILYGLNYMINIQYLKVTLCPSRCLRMRARTRVSLLRQSSCACALPRWIWAD